MNLTFKLIFLGSAILISQSEVFGKAFGGGRDGRGPPGRRHHGPPPLPFLKGLNRTDVEEFLEIRRNDNLTKAEVKQAEDAWAAKQNATVKSVYDEFQVNRTKFEAELKANVTKAAANLSTEAKAIFDQMEAVRDNQNISYREERKQVKAILDGTTKEIRQEIKKILPRPPHGPRGPGGRGGHRGRGGPGGRGGENLPGEDGGPMPTGDEMGPPPMGGFGGQEDEE